jgi:hypothetical protein
MLQAEIVRAAVDRARVRNAGLKGEIAGIGEFLGLGKRA